VTEPLPGPDARPQSDALPEQEPRRRLHPLSPLLRGGSWVIAAIVGLSWNTLAQVGVGRFALIVLALAAGAAVISVVAWLNTGYHVVGRELRIQEGLLRRRNRAIPLERLQSVELVRPLLAQLTGLAELRLEVVGGSKTEAPLAYLSVKDAAALRDRLLALAGRQTPDRQEHKQPQGYGDTQPSVPAPERPLSSVSNSDLLLSQLLTPQAFLLPFGAAFLVIQVLAADDWSLLGIASTVTAMAGVLLQPVRRVLQDWDFRLAGDAEGRLAVRYGLLETRNQTIPLHRVQSLGATWPVLWRAKSWLHLSLSIAGAGDPGSRGNDRSDRLLPVGDAATARALIWEVLPGVDLFALPMTPPPDRARWVHPFALRGLGAGLTDRVFLSRSGLLTRELTIVPFARIQSVRVVQGPLQRRLGLATVYADTAGGRAGAARDRDLHEAWALAAELSLRARHARAESLPAALILATPPTTPPYTPLPNPQPLNARPPTLEPLDASAPGLQSSSSSTPPLPPTSLPPTSLPPTTSLPSPPPQDLEPQPLPPPVQDPKPQASPTPVEESPSPWARPPDDETSRPTA
jgi:putative membrane protein